MLLLFKTLLTLRSSTLRNNQQPLKDDVHKIVEEEEEEEGEEEDAHEPSLMVRMDGREQCFSQSNPTACLEVYHQYTPTVGICHCVTFRLFLPKHRD